MGRKETIALTQEGTTRGYQTIAGGWPDLVFYNKETGDAIFVKDRSTGAPPLREDQLVTMRILEKLGLQVRVTLDGKYDNLLTLDVYLESRHRTLHLQPNTLRNYKSQLSQLEVQLIDYEEGDPLREKVEQKIQRLREVLGIADQKTVENRRMKDAEARAARMAEQHKRNLEAEEASDEELKKVEEAFKNAKA